MKNYLIAYKYEDSKISSILIFAQTQEKAIAKFTLIKNNDIIAITELENESVQNWAWD